jgi:predicted nucleic acid-binding protein
MILLDTSRWVDHLSKSNPLVFSLLDQNKVLCHPFVIGELAMGNLKARDSFLFSLHRLPQTIVAKHHEMLEFIALHELSGLGIGYVDAHLLAATQLTPDARLWTRDKRLDRAAERLGIAYHPQANL